MKKSTIQKKFEDLYKNVDPNDYKQNDRELLKRERLRYASIEQHKDPAQIELRKKKAKEQWSDPAQIEQARRRSKEMMKDPTRREHLRKKGKEQFQDPVALEKRRKQQTERMKDPTLREHLRKKNREQFQDPAQRKLRQELHKKQYSDPTQIAIRKQKQSYKWQLTYPNGKTRLLENTMDQKDLLYIRKLFDLTFDTKRGGLWYRIMGNLSKVIKNINQNPDKIKFNPNGSKYIGYKLDKLSK